MKKIITIVLAVILVATFGMTAFADAAAPTVKVSKFFQSQNAVPEYGTAPSTDEYWNWASKALGQGPDADNADTISVADGVVTWTANGGWLNLDVPGADKTGANSWVDLNSYTYIAFQIENISATSVIVGIIPSAISSGFNRYGEIIAANPRFYNTDGTQANDCAFQVVDMWGNGLERGYVIIPSGKTIWVVLPITGVNVPNFSTYAQDGCFKLSDDSFTAWTTPKEEGDTTFITHTEGSTTPLHLGGIVMTLGAIEDSSNEADISVIAYAAAAIAGLGALAIAKKR